MSVLRLLALDLLNGLAAQFRLPAFQPTVTLSLRASGRTVSVRTASSDLDVIRLIFDECEYSPLNSLERVEVIVDLGANAGYSGLYFLSKFPRAKLVAVEPDPRNVRMLRKNLAAFGNRVTVLEGAIWSHKRELVLMQNSYGDGREWATQVQTATRDDGGPPVTAYDMPYILSLIGGESIDLLKIDIERSELELFGAIDLSWLARVKNIAIELHDAECERVFFRALANYTFDSERSGELTIVTGLSRKPAETSARVRGL